MITWSEMKKDEELQKRIAAAIEDGAGGAIVALYQAGCLTPIPGNNRATDLRFYMEVAGVDSKAIEYWSNF
jgi:hypothetical protein